MEHPFWKEPPQKLLDASAAGGGEELGDGHRCHHPGEIPASFQGAESNRWALTSGWWWQCHPQFPWVALRL